MSMFISLARVSLLAVLCFSLWGTWFLMRTGLIDLMSELRDNGPHLLPGTKESIRQHYTGIAPIDYQLTVLCVFFWSVIDGSHPEYSLHITDFCFQFAVQYGICVIEGSRPINAGRWISYVALWGAIMQNFGVANTLPVFAFLATSPTVHKANAADILPSYEQLASLPFSLLLGYFVPVALMRFPSISTDEQQIWLGVWQAFPLWVALFQRMLPALLGRTGRARTRKEQLQASYYSLRRVYSFLRYLSILGHLLSRGVMLKTLETPKLFASGVPQALHPLNVWIPAFITPAARIPDIGAGAHLFLQYDHIGSSLAVLIFAYILRAQACGQPELSLLGHLGSIAKTIIFAIFLGPAGAAINLLEARDEEILNREDIGAKKLV